MTPDWLQYLENRSRAAASTITEHQRKTSLAHSIVENDIPKLLSALNLAIEGLEFMDQHMFVQTNSISNHDTNEMNRALIPAKNKAREILDKIKRGDL